MSTQHRKIEAFTPWVIRSKDHQVPMPVLPNDPGVVIETPLNQLDSDIVGGPGNSFQSADVGNFVSGQIIDFTNNVWLCGGDAQSPESALSDQAPGGRCYSAFLQLVQLGHPQVVNTEVYLVTPNGSGLYQVPAMRIWCLPRKG